MILQKVFHSNIFCVLGMIVLLWMKHLTAESGWATCDIRLKDCASGGELILVDGLNLNTACIVIETFPNESSTVFAHRFVEFINKTRYNGMTVPYSD